MSMNAPIILCSSKLASKMKKKTTSLRRRRNQKAEIDELASHFQSSTPLTAHQSADDATEQEGISDNKTSAIDKLSVLRLTTAFLKFQNFLKDSESKLLNLALGVHVLRIHVALSID